MLKSYLARLYDTIISRGDIEIELSQAPDLSEVLREIEQLIYSDR